MERLFECDVVPRLQRRWVDPAEIRSAAENLIQKRVSGEMIRQVRPARGAEAEGVEHWECLKVDCGEINRAVRIGHRHEQSFVTAVQLQQRSEVSHAD